MPVKTKPKPSPHNIGTSPAKDSSIMTIDTEKTLAAAPGWRARRVTRTARPRPTCDPTSGRIAEARDNADSTPSKLPQHPSQASRASAGEVRQAGIVCGTDFSIHAHEAADVAAALASKLRTDLTLVHVVERARGNATSRSLNAMLRYRGRNQLKREAERVNARGITVGEAFLSGSPATELVKVATRRQAGLIVVSSLGQVPPARWLLGSVAEHTANHSPVPVLVVRDPKPFRDWASGKRSLNILVGHDFSASADAALALVATLREIGRCRITVAHLPTTQVATGWLEVGGKPGSKKSLVEVRELLKGDLIQRCRGPLGKSRFQVEVISARDSVALRLVSLAKIQGADLIVVGTNQKGALRRLCLGSVSREVLRCAQTNVACVPGASPTK